MLKIQLITSEGPKRLEDGFFSDPDRDFRLLKHLLISSLRRVVWLSRPRPFQGTQEGVSVTNCFISQTCEAPHPVPRRGVKLRNPAKMVKTAFCAV